MLRHCLATLVLVVVAVAAILPVRADPAADETAIRQRLQRWTADFNAKDLAGVCDLFAPDLRYSIPETVNGTYETMCTSLTRVLGRTDIRLHYAMPDIHEIVVSGDIAVVRLTWTLTTQAGGARDTTTEAGMDIFRRQPDGRWSIARFVAFTTRPNALLK
jgi:ketosteroid isomerase-like protein